MTLKDRKLERFGLLDYQTKGLSKAEIAARYASFTKNTGIGVDQEWVNEKYASRPSGNVQPTQSLNGMQGVNAERSAFTPPQPITPRPAPEKKTGDVISKNDGWYSSALANVKNVQGRPVGVVLPGDNPMNLETGFMTSQLNPYAENFDWAKLTVEQKKAVATSPSFEMSKVIAPGQQGAILSDKNFGLYSRNKNQNNQDNLGLPFDFNGKTTTPPSTAPIRTNYGALIYPKTQPTTYGSQELQWWQPVAFSLLSDPKTTPLVQAAAMIGMGAAVGGVGGAAAAAAVAIPMTAMAYAANMKGDENPFKNKVGIFSEWVLKKLMWGAQTLEQLQGLTDYLSEGKASESRGVKWWEPLAGPLVAGVIRVYRTGAEITGSRLLQFISDPKLRSAVWEASKVYYETQGSKQQPFTERIQSLISYMPDQQQKDTIKAINAVLPLVKDENQVWVLGENETVPVQPGYSLDDAVKRVLNGESGDAVLADYQRAYGVSGVASDFMLSSIYDPLNVLPVGVGRTNAGIADIKASKLTNLGVLSEAQTARVTIEKMKADIYRATPGMTGMLVSWNEASRKFRSLIAATPDVAKHLTDWERKIAGVTADGRVKELIGVETGAKLPNGWQRLWLLQPEAKANIFRDKLTENMNLVLENALATGRTDPKAMIDVIEAASKMDMVTLKDLGAEYLGSPEAYTTIGAARDVIPQLRADQLAYESLTPNRDMFLKLAQVIGEEPRVVLEGFLKDKARSMFERLKDKLQTVDTPEARALLKAIEEGKLTADNLKQTFKPLESAPLNDVEFMARINERMYDHLKDWGKEYFGVKDHNKWDESLRLLKGAQSLMLLDVNPQSILNDFVNERVMMIAGGTLGLTSADVIGKFKQDFGIWPENAGGSGILGDVATEKVKLSADMKENKSLIGTAADKLNTFRSYLPRSALSSRFNAAHHDQMIYAGIKEYWGRNFIEGKGFDRMPASLEARLREYNVDPQLVYRNARSVLKPEQLELLKTRVTSHDIGNYIGYAADKVGKTPAELTALLEKIGVLDDLRAGLDKADTPQKRQQAFEALETKVQEYIDQRIQQEIPGKIQDYIDKIKTEGHGGAMQIMGEVAMQTMDTRMVVDEIWDTAYARVAELEEFGLGSAGANIMEEAARRADTSWRRTQTREAIYYTAAAEVLGFGGEFKAGYLKSLGDQHTLRREYFTEHSRAWRQWRDTIYPNRETRSAAAVALRIELNTKFKAMQDETLNIQQKMDDLYVDEMGVKFGEQAGVMTNAWTTKVLKASQEIHEMIVGFRDRIKGMSPADRANAWKKFKPEYQAAYRERMKVDMDGAANLWKGDETSPPVARDAATSPQIQRTDLGGEVRPLDTPTAKVDEARVLAGASKQRRGDAARAEAERIAPVWDVAEQYPLGDGPFNRSVDHVSLLAVLRKEEYGGIPGLEMNDPRVTPEFVQNVLDQRVLVKNAAAVSPETTRITLPEAEGRLIELEAQYARASDAGSLAEYMNQLSEIKDNLARLEQAVPETADRGLLARLITAQRNVSDRLSVTGNYLDAQELIGFQRALDTDPQSPLFQETGQPSDPRQLFKDGGDMPLLAPGAYDQLASRMDATKIFEDGWSDQIRPALDAMKESANSQERRYTFEGMDAQTQKELNQWVSGLAGKMTSLKRAAMKWGETNADYGLLNYERQYGFDKIFSAIVPYEFFGTRTASNWIARVMDRPAFISQYLRFMNLRKTYENDLPERMRGKMWIPVPFLNEWAGGGMWIDPTNQLIPFKQFLQPLTAYKRDQNNLINNTMYALRDMEEDPNVNQTDLKNAMDTQSGQLWERAQAKVKADQGENTTTGSDYFSMLFSPALYATIPYYMATGKKLWGINSSWPSGQLPITRVGSGLETAFKGTSLEFIGEIAGLMAKPEQLARKALGLNEFGEWGEYYIERQLVNMAAEDGGDPKAVQKALIEKSGVLYEEATNRVRYELMLKVPGMAPLYMTAHGASLDKIAGSLLTSLYPGGLLPPAEMEYKGLKQEYSQAWAAKDNGNDGAIGEFFDAHPEYEARLALRKDPEERLQQFLQSEVWDAYGALGPTDRKKATADLGLKEFFEAEPGTEYTTEELVGLVRALKGMVPQTPVTAPMLEKPAPKLDMYDPSVTAITDQFFSQRSVKFPDYYAVQQGYYAQASRGEKTKYLLQHPELKAYWDWKDGWYEAYPQYKPIMSGQVFKRVDMSNFPPALLNYLEMYALTGKRLPSGAYKSLEQVWIEEGQPMDDLQDWLDGTVVPAIMYQGQ